MSIKPLPMIYKRPAYSHGHYNHILVKRESGCVIWRVEDRGATLGWEVGKVVKSAYRVGLPGHLNKESYTHYEKKFRDEDFGKTAWYYTDFNKAWAKYNELGVQS